MVRQVWDEPIFAIRQLSREEDLPTALVNGSDRRVSVFRHAFLMCLCRGPLMQRYKDLGQCGSRVQVQLSFVKRGAFS